jgi:hypothetical protein
MQTHTGGADYILESTLPNHGHAFPLKNEPNSQTSTG